MTSQIWWFLSRGSGIVAWLTIAATNVWGIVMVTRIFRAARPAWMLDLHRWLGALAIITTAVHMGALVADSYVYFGWKQLFVPNGSDWKAAAVTWGVVAFYLMVVIQLTSLMMKRLPRRLWHSIHLLSYVLFACATVHAALAGTDRSNRVYVAAVVAVVAVVIGGVTLRVTRQARRSRNARPASPVAEHAADAEVTDGALVG